MLDPLTKRDVLVILFLRSIKAEEGKARVYPESMAEKAAKKEKRVTLHILRCPLSSASTECQDCIGDSVRESVPSSKNGAVCCSMVILGLVSSLDLSLFVFTPPELLSLASE